MEVPSLFIAFIAGFLSFLSPCVLPLVPAYIGYLGGSVVRSGQPARPRQKSPAMAGATSRVVPAQDGVPAAVPANTMASTAMAAAPARAGGVSAGSAGMSSERAMRPARQPMPKPEYTAAMRWVTLTHAIVFVLAFSLVFAVIGGLLGSLRDVFLGYNPLFPTLTNRRILEYIMGVLLVVFGLHMIGLINIPFLNYERRLGDKLRPGTSLSYVRSFLIGLGFGVGWTPCVGPTLSLIFTMAMGGQSGEAVLPFVAYSIGLGVPFLIAALAMGQISAFLKKITRRGYSVTIGSWKAIDRVNVVSLVSGLLLVVMGIFIFTDLVTLLAPNLPGFFNV
jgi:cytochrome c-type biogenesis protein